MGESAVLVEAEPPTILSNRYILALAATLEAQVLTGVGAIIPGISSLLVHFDPHCLSSKTVEHLIQNLLAEILLPSEDNSPIVTLPVLYGGTLGPDLEVVATLVGLTPREVVAEHCRQVYHVLAIGFAPGFPYIGPVGPALTVPRRATPRTVVPAGSVALAAGLTCVYPAALPGGWQLIGTTSVRLFDPLAARPALLKAGDRIRFEPLAGGVTP